MLRSAICALPALISTTATADPPQPLPPVGKWVVDGRIKELDCLLSRDFGDPAHPIGLAIKPSLTGYATIAVSFETKTLQRFPGTKGKVTVLPAALAVVGERSFKYVPGTGRETVAVSLNPSEGQALLAGLPNASAIRLEIGDRSFLFSTNSIRSASVTLAACRDGIARALGVDPTAVIQAPSERLIQWVKPEDYPSSDRKALLGNRTIVLLTIGPNGKPTACRTATSSGRAAWDETTCTALLRRASYGQSVSGPMSRDRYGIVRVGWTAIGSNLIPIAEDTF